MSTACVQHTALAHVALVLVCETKSPAAYVVALQHVVTLSAVNRRAYAAAYPATSHPAPVTLRQLFDAMMAVPGRVPNMHTAYEAVRSLSYNFLDEASPAECALMLQVDRDVGAAFLAWFKGVQSKASA